LAPTALTFLSNAPAACLAAILLVAGCSSASAPTTQAPQAEYSYTVTDSSGTTTYSGVATSSVYVDSSDGDDDITIQMGDSSGAVEVTTVSTSILPGVGTYVGCEPIIPFACVALVGQLIPPSYHPALVVDTVTISSASSAEIDGNFVLDLEAAPPSQATLATVRGSFRAVATTQALAPPPARAVSVLTIPPATGRQPL
jgi:hypothetical protein